MPTLEFVKYEFLTHTVNFCTRSAFSEGPGLDPGPLYTVCRVLENFNGTICLNQEYGCKVKLPFKETRDILHDPFALCEKHLSKLNTYLKNDTVLLKKYNDIFSDKTKLGNIEKLNKLLNPATVWLIKTKSCMILAVQLTSSKQVSLKHLKTIFII